MKEPRGSIPPGRSMNSRINMGQAKARGPQELRMIEGIAKRKEQERVYEEMVQRRKAQDKEYLASLSEKELQDVLGKRALIRQLMSMSVDYTF